MKKQILAGVLLATTMVVGVGADNSYAEYNEYRGDVPENGGGLNSPFVITEVNLRDNYLKVVYNGGMEGEVRLRNVDILTWSPEAAGGKNSEDYFDWNLPSIHYSTPSFAYVVYNKSQYLFGNKFAKGVEETITGGEMYSPLANSPNMKLYYSLYIGETASAPTSYYTGKISYERCAGSRVFNKEEMTCKVEMKADGSGIQYQPYIIATGERVEVPEDYDVEPEPIDNGDDDGGGTGDDRIDEGIIDDGLGGNEGGGVTSSSVARQAEEVASTSSDEQVVVTSAVKRSAGMVATTSVTGGEMVVATPVDTKKVERTGDGTEVLGESLGSLGNNNEDKSNDWNGWGVLIGVLGVLGALMVGWWLFLLAKRRKKDEEEQQ